MKEGYEEQYALENSKRIIEETKSKLNLDSLMENKEKTYEQSYEETSGGLDNKVVRVRTNLNTPVYKDTRESFDNSINYYNPVSLGTSDSNLPSNKAYASVLILMEVVSLIFLVSLITFVVLRGIS